MLSLICKIPHVPLKGSQIQALAFPLLLGSTSCLGEADRQGLLVKSLLYLEALRQHVLTHCQYRPSEPRYEPGDLPDLSKALWP